MTDSAQRMAMGMNETAAVSLEPPRRSEALPFARPLIGEEEIDEVVDTLRSDWLTTGPKTARFESEFASYLSAPGALALNSCTGALHTALATLGVGSGDEVITTPMTFAATVNVIELLGARPVLVDVEPDTLNLAPELVEQAITARTKAILPVHFAGHPVDLDAINGLAQMNDLAVIEDAAHALPAQYKGRTIGSSRNPTCFSFYPIKNMTTGEGGMLTGEPGFLERARCLSLHGMSRDARTRYEKGGSWYYEITAPGFKYNMTDIQASLGLWQLRKLDRFQQRRRAVVAAYNSAFAHEEALELPVKRGEVDHAWHLYVIRLKLEALRIDRNRFIAELANRNISTSVHFIPIHLHPYYRDKYRYRAESFAVAYNSYRRMLSLPLNPRLSDEDVADVIGAVYDVIATHRR